MLENTLVSLLLFFKSMGLIGPTLYAKYERISFLASKNIGPQRPKIDFLSSRLLVSSTRLLDS